MISNHDPRFDPSRVIRAPRGNQIVCKNWLIEAAYRMVQNNLDAEVAEDPKNLVVYGGIKPDLVTDQTSSHDLINGYLPSGWTVPQWKAAQQDAGQHARLTADAARSCAAHVQAMLDFHAMGIPTVDYGNNLR